MKTFRSSCSKGMFISSVLIGIFLLSIEINLLYTLISKPFDALMFCFFLLVFLIIAGTVTYLYLSHPVALSITDEYLIIIKKRGRIVIPRSNIVAVTPKKNVMWDMSLWGFSGLFGHIGWFRSARLGNYFALANNGNTLIFIQTNGRKYVVNCDNREEFIESLQKTKRPSPLY